MAMSALASSAMQWEGIYTVNVTGAEGFSGFFALY